MRFKIFSNYRFQSETRTSLINIKPNKLSTCRRIKFLNRYMIVVPAFCKGAQKVFDFSWGRVCKRIKVFRKFFPIYVDCNPVHSRLVTRIQIKNVCRGELFCLMCTISSKAYTPLKFLLLTLSFDKIHRNCLLFIFLTNNL